MLRLNMLVAATLSTFGILHTPPDSAAEEIRRVSGPHVHENLAIYFVHGASAPGPVPLTLSEALQAGTIEVTETGSVERLVIENRGDQAVFVQLGDIVKGGKQDRVLTVSFLLPPHSGPLPIGAYCVERGRWSPRGKEAAHLFSSALRMLPSKRSKLALVDPRTKRKKAADQSRQQVIWTNVAKMQNELSEAIGTNISSPRSASSLQLSLENQDLVRRVDDYVDALTPKAKSAGNVVGFVFAVNGRINSGDVYPSNGLFEKMWPKLLHAAATEALANQGGPNAAPPPSPAIRSFLEAANNGTLRERLGSGGITRETRDSEKSLRTAAKTRSGQILHLSYIGR